MASQQGPFSNSIKTPYRPLHLPLPYSPRPSLLPSLLHPARILELTLRASSRREVTLLPVLPVTLVRRAQRWRLYYCKSRRPSPPLNAMRPQYHELTAISSQKLDHLWSQLDFHHPHRRLRGGLQIQCPAQRLRTPLGSVVPLDAKRRPCHRRPELHHARGRLLRPLSSLHDHGLHSLVQAMEASKRTSHLPQHRNDLYPVYTHLTPKRLLP